MTFRKKNSIIYCSFGDSMREKVILVCEECLSRNYTIDKNKLTNPKRMEIKNNEWKELKDFDARSKRKGKAKIDDPLKNEIAKAVRMNKSKKVKPNHKKKMKEAVEKVKRKHNREIIKNDIQKRIRQRAINKNKGEQND